MATDDLRYAVEFHGKRLMDSARLGLELVGQPALGPGMHLKATQPESVDQTYTIPVGKTRACAITTTACAPTLRTPPAAS